MLQGTLNNAGIGRGYRYCLLWWCPSNSRLLSTPVSFAIRRNVKGNLLHLYTCGPAPRHAHFIETAKYGNGTWFSLQRAAMRRDATSLAVHKSLCVASCPHRHIASQSRASYCEPGFRWSDFWWPLRWPLFCCRQVVEMLSCACCFLEMFCFPLHFLPFAFPPPLPPYVRHNAPMCVLQCLSAGNHWDALEVFWLCQLWPLYSLLWQWQAQSGSQVYQDRQKHETKVCELCCNISGKFHGQRYFMHIHIYI